MNFDIIYKLTLGNIKNFIYKKYFSFPTLKFLLNTKKKNIKNLYVDFWVHMSKKNLNFKKFFFNSKINTFNENVYLDIQENINYLNQSCEKILQTNGILVIENALPQNEHSKIINIFNKLKIKNTKSLRQNDFIQKYFEEIEISNFSNLNKISNFFTKMVYGRSLKALMQFHIHQCNKIPEKIINGDNNMHIDRFLPNMKLYYSPFEITKDDAPFCYALGSHKINSQYIEYIKNAKHFSEEDSESLKFLNFKKELFCKKNTLIVALTNGFHGRKPFEKTTKRQVVFLQYHKSFNKFSLLFG